MDYKQTVFLPKTEFPMRGGLPKKEPEIMAHWEKLDLYKKLRAERKDAPKFVLHDGPPCHIKTSGGSTAILRQAEPDCHAQGATDCQIKATGARLPY